MARIAITTLTVALLGLVAVRAASNDTSTTANTTEAVQTESRDANGNTALMAAAAYGDTYQVRRLIKAGALVNARGRIGNTALLYAAQEGHIEIAHLLIEAGADARAANEYGSTPRSLALGYGHADLVELIDAAPERDSSLLASLF